MRGVERVRINLKVELGPIFLSNFGFRRSILEERGILGYLEIGNRSDGQRMKKLEE